MEEEEELKKKQAKALEAKKAEAQLKATLRIALEDAAYDRLMNVSLANKELFLVAARQLLMGFKRVGRRLTDKEVLGLLRAIREQTKSETETRITFQRK